MWLAAVTLRDGIGADDLIFAAGVVSAVMTICGFVWWATRPARQAAEHWHRFWDDWRGEPAAPGRSAVPGVMERLARIDGEFQRNGGASMKDLLHSTARKVDALGAEVADVKRTIHEKECP
jgi:hypothetical protein